MARYWVFLLLIGTGSAFNHINKPPMEFDEVSKVAVQQYNLESGAKFLFRKGSTFHSKKWCETWTCFDELNIDILAGMAERIPAPSQIQTFSITIQETVCKGNPETTDIDKCDFKPNGVTKSCLGQYKYRYGEVGRAKILIDCNNV